MRTTKTRAKNSSVICSVMGSRPLNKPKNALSGCGSVTSDANDVILPTCTLILITAWRQLTTLYWPLQMGVIAQHKHEKLKIKECFLPDHTSYSILDISQVLWLPSGLLYHGFVVEGSPRLSMYWCRSWIRQEPGLDGARPHDRSPV